MSASAGVLLVLHRAARAGSEFHTLWLAQGLRSRGWEVHLAISEDGPLLEGFREAGVSVHTVVRRRGVDLAYVASMAELARRLRVDVLHAHSGRLPMLAGRLGGVSARVETRHGLGVDEAENSESRWRAEARRCRLAHMTLTVSRTDRNRLIAGGLAADRVRYIANGIPTTEVVRAAPNPGRIRIGFLGRLAEQKDPLFLVALAAELDSRIPNGWSLVVAGDGPLRVPLENGLRSRPVRFLGEVSGPATLLEQIDILCVPSTWEGQSLAVLEAMAAGVVVVGREIPTLVELLGGPRDAGLLLPKDPAAWASAIVSLTSDPARQDGLRREAAARIREEHGLEQMVERIESAYRETLVAAGRG